MDFNNDVDDLAPGVSSSGNVDYHHEVADQPVNDVEDKSYLNRDMNQKKIHSPFSLESVRDLSVSELSELLIEGRSGDTANETIEREYAKNIKSGREQSIHLEGLRFGSQGALYKRMGYFQEKFESKKGYLSRAFNFSPLLLLGGRVIPPIIGEANNLSMSESKYVDRDVKASYKIIKQAEVVSIPIDWRSFLLMDFPAPKLPSKFSMPVKSNEREMSIWSNGVSKGWEAGTTQANEIMIQKIKELDQAYTGMALYHYLLKKRYVTSPITSNTSLGVTGNDDTLNIGETVFEIVDLPKFNKDVEKWRALPRIQSPLDF